MAARVAAAGGGVTARRRKVGLDAAELRVDGGADTTVYVGEPILPHGISIQVRCKLTEAAAMTVFLVTMAREIDKGVRLQAHEKPQADHVPSGALDVPEDDYDESQRRHGRPFIGFQL
jgi:hypothetical protein